VTCARAFHVDATRVEGRAASPEFSTRASSGILSGVIGLANDGSHDQLTVPAPGSAILATIAGPAPARRGRS
jgi:hypothetical protein